MSTEWGADLNLISIKSMIEFYKEENARQDEYLKKMKLLSEDSKFDVTIDENIDKLIDVLEIQYDEKNSKVSTKPHNYFSRLTTSLKMYKHMNKKLSEDINTAEMELKLGREKLKELNFHSSNTNQLRAKVTQYDLTNSNYEKKYPWLKDPLFDMQNLDEECKKLQKLKKTKENLDKELKQYSDLKPDLIEAAEQLTQIQKEHSKFTF
ncbi:unnamed protein product [Phyllotreta striolata]|uniref:Uncharacterized protein n=1 Tax=Phyllotreta striolata TaxID=444603 RepID=A0A9N9TE63_PHYSR|nr:unnamed protein product [Phyllotreta striolata]